MNKQNKGFTLIEILVVIGIIAILAAVVLIAINPARQFAQARNSQRSSNVNTILNAYGQNLADNKGVSTCTDADLGAVVKNIGTDAANVDLSTCLATYLASGIPMDPEATSATDTKYTIVKTATGVVTVCAPEAVEASIPGSAAICVSR